MVRRAFAMICITLVAVVASGACGGSGPSRKDVLPEAYLVYPGAREINRIWTPEERGSGIDGNDLSHAAGLSLYYRLPPGTDSTEVDRWYDQRLVAAGWRLRADTGAFRTYAKAVGPRTHWYDLTTHDVRGDADVIIAYHIGERD